MSSHPRFGPSGLLSRSLNAQGSPQSSSQPPYPPHASSSGTPKKKRTSHACDRCRLMRIKCTGGARCTRCTKDDAVCVYGYHKREQDKKDLADARSRVRDLEDENRQLLSALRGVTSGSDFRSEDHTDVMDLLSQYVDDDAVGTGTPTRSESRSRELKSSSASTAPTRNEEGGEVSVSSAIGSPGRQGELPRIVDLDHGVGAAGFIGKMSEMSWMQRCRQYLIDRPSSSSTNIESPGYEEHVAGAADLAYFTDDVDLLSVDEDHVNDSQWPQMNAAILYAQAYFHVTAGAFEFVSHDEFFATMRAFPREHRMLSWAQRRWLAVANLIWAVGAKWLCIAKLDEPDTSVDHLLFFARARALGLDHRLLFDHPDVQMIQGIGLLAFYLLVNGSITRAWNIIGNAVHHAMSLGLHLQVSDPSISIFEQKRRACTWFSLYKLQVLLAEITGRPHLIRTAHVTIPLEICEESAQDHPMPVSLPIDHEFSSQARQTWSDFLSFQTDVLSPAIDDIPLLSSSPHIPSAFPYSLFLYHIRLCQLSEEVADQLYTGCHTIPWVQTQARIEELQRALEAWAVTMPEDLKLSSLHEKTQYPRANIQLAMYSYSVHMMLHRPCLCEIYIENESERSREFNMRSARFCVDAALSMVKIMPDDFVPHKVFQLLPWWTLLHYLCQAASVLLLELCLEAQHFQGEASPIIAAIWKVMNYLACMSEGSLSAYKAWRIFREFLTKVNSRYGNAQLYDVSQKAITPPNWSSVDEEALLGILQ